MASSTLGSIPTSINDLPVELGCNLTQYLGPWDLAEMRCVNSYWNDICRTEMRLRHLFAFTFEDLDTLADFNDTFTDETPTEDIASGWFCFELAALDTAAAKVPLDTFVQRFGHIVISLSLNLSQSQSTWTDNQEWFASDRRDTVLTHVTLLLHGVKGQVEVLELSDYIGLDACVFGPDPFPWLRTLILGNHSSSVGSLSVTAQQEASIMYLSRKVPAVREFEFTADESSGDGDPAFLANVLRNLVRANDLVEVKLDMTLVFFDDTDDDSVLLQELMRERVRVVSLGVTIDDRGSDQPDKFRMAMNWIGAQSDWLKKLTLRVSVEEEGVFAGLMLPSLRALEELDYVQETVESLLNYTAADYPNLRKVTTVSTGNDFTVALPQVTDLTVMRTRYTGIAARELGKFGKDLFQLPPFRNLETLTCPVKFIDLGVIVTLQTLRRLKVTTDALTGDVFAFWKRATPGSRTLTVDQIRALPEPSEDEIRSRAEPCFSDLPNFKEFTMVMNEDYMMRMNLEALLFISKMKKLQRLQKLEIQLEQGNAVDAVYMDELERYHDSVVVGNADQPEA